MSELLADVMLSLSGLGAWAPVLFITVYIIATVTLFPGVVLSLAGGALFGVRHGVVYVFIGAALGAAASFGISRSVARRYVTAWMSGHPRWAAVSEAVRGQGVLVVILLRLSPLVPYNLLNYALGVTNIRFRDYFMGSAGMLPSTFLYVYSGKVIGDLAGVMAGRTEAMGAPYYALLSLGFVATACVTYLITRNARAALERLQGQ